MQANDHAAAANWLASAAEQLPYRADLWESAGHQSMLAGNPSLAIDYFAAAADLGGLSTLGQVAMGAAYQQEGDLSTAIQIWETSLRNDDPDPQAYWLLAAAQRQLGRYAEAIENLRALTQISPSNAAAQYQLGLLFAATEPRSASAYLALAQGLDPQYGGSVATLRSALRRAQFDNPPAYVLTVAGQALSALDEWDLARAAFLSATENDPTYAEAWAYLGEANQQLGEPGLTELEVALALDPQSLSANIFLSLYLQRQNKMEDALFYMEYAAELAPLNPALQADLGALYLRIGDLAGALEHYQRATELSPREPRYWVLLATFSVEHEVYLEEAGLPAALEAYSLAPEDTAVLVLLGRAYFLLGDQINAADYYLNALAINPDYAPAHLHIGLLYLALDNRTAARLEFQLAIQLDPEGQTALFAQQLLAMHFP